uniref:Epidermal patterning factor-like protein n=1 Tax=Ananas comosus var. bracteatus TaxID=296719 RepID=A0A6V7NU72_ANACO|nr:unnamed protein product [Ananas comosus var. bracteatus]
MRIAIVSVSLLLLLLLPTLLPSAPATVGLVWAKRSVRVGGGVDGSTEGGGRRREALGSRPPRCVNKCSSCSPCTATLVVSPHGRGPRPRPTKKGKGRGSFANPDHRLNAFSSLLRLLSRRLALPNLLFPRVSLRPRPPPSPPLSPLSSPPPPPRSAATRGSSRRRAAANSGAPPPPGGDSDDLSGLQERISRVQDRVRIFFAVLFWMSLFFWASACDGRDKPRNKKKFRFRK